MSYFYVTIETINSINPIEGADRIQRATLDNLSFQFVIGKDLFKVGDKVLYFPIDALIPEDLAKTLGVFGKLAGRDKNRVKTVKLRGTLSQGVVGPVSIITSLTEQTPEAITEFLKVTKYEPPSILEKGANLKALPCGLSVYDIEGCERHKHIVDMLMSQTVHVSEKMEGSNFSVSFDGEKVYVNQRRHTIELIEGVEKHTWWKVAEEQGLIDLAKLHQARRGQTVTIYGEMVGPGIQGNIYKLPKHTIFVFDVKIGEAFMDASEFVKWTETHGVKTAPTIAISTLEDFLKPYPSIVAASNGNSLVFSGTLREGIVIKPMYEQTVDRFGRLIIKQRDPIYLASNEN